MPWGHNPVTAILWFRQDLRLRDHAPLLRACAENDAVVPVFIWNPAAEWSNGAASRGWLHHALADLADQLEKIGSRLIVRQGKPAEVLRELQIETQARKIYAQRLVEPAARADEQAVEAALPGRLSWSGIADSQMLFSPEVVLTGQGTVYRVYKPFYRNCLSQPSPRSPLAAPKAIPPLPSKGWPNSLLLDALGLLPQQDWTSGIAADWEIGEAAAHRRLRTFTQNIARDYEDTRNLPGVDGTSCLSPYLQFGQLSPHQVWHGVQEAGFWESHVFLREILFREFAHHLLYHCPNLPDQSLDARFEDFDWNTSPKNLRAWQRGQTGYPIVDAGMRQLWATGWMHNRVRMIVGSFLVKDLLLPWREGEAWFWDTLVDASLGNNAFNWQWVGGCGADASPFFRVFNPTLQGEKFDPKGDYVRRWVPELKALPDRWVHKPAEAPDEVMEKAGITLGKDYPEPLVVHSDARQEALKRYKAIKR